MGKIQYDTSARRYANENMKKITPRKYYLETQINTYCAKHNLTCEAKDSKENGERIRTYVVSRENKPLSRIKYNNDQKTITYDLYDEAHKAWSHQKTEAVPNHNYQILIRIFVNQAVHASKVTQNQIQYVNSTEPATDSSPRKYDLERQINDYLKYHPDIRCEVSERQDPLTRHEFRIYNFTDTTTGGKYKISYDNTEKKISHGKIHLTKEYLSPPTPLSSTKYGGTINTIMKDINQHIEHVRKIRNQPDPGLIKDDATQVMLNCKQRVSDIKDSQRDKEKELTLPHTKI